MLLDEKVIEQLTGYKRYKCQIRWLAKNGIRYAVGYDGKPKVTVSHFEEVMSGSNKQKAKKRIEPNFEALKERNLV